MGRTEKSITREANLAKRKENIGQENTNQTERKIELLTEMLSIRGISRDEIISAAIDVGVNVVLGVVLSEEEFGVRTTIRNKLVRPHFHGEIIPLG
ncbi:MAG: hypothetical protein E6Q97_03315 [Desulfurellales bacterium]|nr:MAG: hypothetical protein E6Q97_03315 [Desulfurellales bacterium]